MTRMTRWYVANAINGSPAHTHYHRNGWEPFAVTGDGALTTIWFRMAVEREYDDESAARQQAE